MINSYTALGQDGCNQLMIVHLFVDRYHINLGKLHPYHKLLNGKKKYHRSSHLPSNTNNTNINWILRLLFFIFMVFFLVLCYFICLCRRKWGRLFNKNTQEPKVHNIILNWALNFCLFVTHIFPLLSMTMILFHM